MKRQRRELKAVPEREVTFVTDDRPIWLRHYIKNRHNYLYVMIFKSTDLESYDEAVDYLADLTARLSSSPLITQATLYDENFGAGSYAKKAYAQLEQYRARLARARERGKLDWMIYLRFTALDFEAVREQVDRHVASAMEAFPKPPHVEKVNAIYHIENHLVVRHEPYDALGVAKGIAAEGSPGANKFANYGFSKPARNSNDPATQIAYIDWYQEVRQHDSLRANFPDEIGRMWLQVSAEQPFDFWCLTTYEYCAKDVDTIKTATGSAYYAMNRYRGDTADLYHPYYEGSAMVITEYMKPY
jgi:hypothetical protein